MAVVSTVVIAKDEDVVTINVRDLATFEADDWVVAEETVTATAQSTSVTMSWLTVPQLREIAVDSGIQNPSEYATKAALVLEILRVKGLVTYAVPEE